MSIKPQLKVPKFEESMIKDVYIDNFVQEVKHLTGYLEHYKYIAFDTEFPGVVYQNTSNTRDSYYRTIKTNVDKLKLIQLGITISDENCNYPPNVCTWQFNLKFDLNTDHYSNESIALLTNSGINFEVLESRGIPIEVFGEYMISSGLILNEDLHWISFHGIYDFAYYLRSVTNQLLPESENLFFDSLKLYFPNFYDIRHLVRYHDNFRCSLARLAQELGLSRVGLQHQAGSDSLLTLEIFFKLKKEFLSDDSWRSDRNVLFGIGSGSNDEADNNYQQNTYYNNSAYKPNVNNNYNYDYNNYYQQNMNNMQYNYMRTGQPYFNPVNNYGFPYNNFNQMNMFQMNNGNLIGQNKEDNK